MPPSDRTRRAERRVERADGFFRRACTSTREALRAKSAAVRAVTVAKNVQRAAERNVRHAKKDAERSRREELKQEEDGELVGAEASSSEEAPSDSEGDSGVEESEGTSVNADDNYYSSPVALQRAEVSGDEEECGDGLPLSSDPESADKAVVASPPDSVGALLIAVAEQLEPLETTVEPVKKGRKNRRRRARPVPPTSASRSNSGADQSSDE